MSHPAVARYTRLLADALELRDWTFNIEYDADLDEAKIATIAFTYGRKIGHITLGRDFWSQTKHEQRHIIAHELIHAHIDPADTLLAPIEAMIGTPAMHVLRESHHTALEHATDALASAIAHHLPLPPTLKPTR